jgi:hypothetical protein
MLDSILSQFRVQVFQYENSFWSVFAPSRFASRRTQIARATCKLTVEDNRFRWTGDNRRT